MEDGVGTTATNDQVEENQLHRHHYNLQHHDEPDVSGGRWPAWLRPMLSTRFFVQCTKPHHDDAGNAATTASIISSKATECNMYCLDCSSTSGALCPLCVPSHRRAGHRTVQIRRSSYHDVVRVGEIQRVLDVSGVQTYVINSARVMFLNERPQTKGKGGSSGRTEGGGGANACEVCRRVLLDSFRFCSLGCKVSGTSKSKKPHMKNHNNFLLSAHESDSEGSCTTTDDRRSRSSDIQLHHRFGFGAFNYHNSAKTTQPAAAVDTCDNPAKRRRKGVPHRAPTGTSLEFDCYNYWRSCDHHRRRN